MGAGAAPPRRVTQLTIPADEKELRKRVMDLARDFGWLRMHPLRAQLPPDRGSAWTTNAMGEKGYPDVTLVHPLWGRVVVLELKGPRGQTSPEQRRWMRAWQTAAAAAPGTIAAYVVKPADWPAVQRLLTRPNPG